MPGQRRGRRQIEALACLRVATPPAERFNTFESHPAATNAWRPHQVSGIAYLPNILHKCDRFDLSPRTNGKSKCSETRPMGAGRRQIESVALCVWQCHLRNVSTLSKRGVKRLAAAAAHSAMPSGGTRRRTGRGTGGRTRRRTGGRTRRRPWSPSHRLSRRGTMLCRPGRGLRHVAPPAWTRTRRIVADHRTGRVAVPRGRRRRNHDSRLPGVHDDRMLQNGGLLRRLDARAVAMGADGRAIGMGDNLRAVTDRAKRPVDIASVHPGSRRHASGRQDQCRSRQSRREVLVHDPPPFYKRQGG